MPRLNNPECVSACGLITHYNPTELPLGPGRINILKGMIMGKNIRM